MILRREEKIMNCKVIVSIIMPVYNSQEYVAEAIQSVLNQSYKNFELIIIDDGSIDNSGLICDEFANKDTRIKVVHQRNSGCCAARNRGIGLSKGEFITFIDNDDIYMESYLETTIGLMKKDTDLVKCGRKNIGVNKNGKVFLEIDLKYNECELSYMEFAKKYLRIRASGILSSVWNGIYRASVIKNNSILFKEELKHGNEDIIFNSEYILKCRNINICERVLYHHYIRNGHSTSSKFYFDQITTKILALDYERNIIKGISDDLAEDKFTVIGIVECYDVFFKAVSIKDKEMAITYIDDKYLKKYKLNNAFFLLYDLPLKFVLAYILISNKKIGLYSFLYTMNKEIQFLIHKLTQLL